MIFFVIWWSIFIEFLCAWMLSSCWSCGQCVWSNETMKWKKMIFIFSSEKMEMIIHGWKWLLVYKNILANVAHVKCEMSIWLLFICKKVWWKWYGWVLTLTKTKLHTSSTKWKILMLQPSLISVKKQVLHLKHDQ